MRFDNHEEAVAAGERAMGEEEASDVRAETAQNAAVAGLRMTDRLRRSTRVVLTPRQVYDALVDQLGVLPIGNGPGDSTPLDLTMRVICDERHDGVEFDDNPAKRSVSFSLVSDAALQPLFEISWSTETVEETCRALGEQGEADKLYARLQEAGKGGGGARLSAAELEAALRLLERLR